MYRYFRTRQVEKLKDYPEIILKPFLLETGDFLFNTRNTLELVGKSAVWNNNLPKAVFNSNIMRIKFHNNLADDFYLGYYFSFGDGWYQFKRITTGTTSVAAIYTKGLLKCKITIPPLPQQQKIAKILSTVDTVIEKTEAAIAKYKAIKQGMMHDLFTRGIDTNTGKLRPTYQEAPELYKDSELGMIPKEWEVKRLEEVCIVNQGLQIPISERFNLPSKERFLYITIQYLNNPQEEAYTYYIENPSDSVICTKKDILMVRTGNTGMVVTNIEGVFHNNFFKIKYNKNIHQEYLVYYLKRENIQTKILNYAGTTTIPDLKHGDFYKIPFLLISRQEQEHVANTINALDQKLQTEESALSKYKQIKAGLMADLLTGRVGVSVN